MHSPFLALVLHSCIAEVYLPSDFLRNRGNGHFPMCGNRARFREYILAVLDEIRARTRDSLPQRGEEPDGSVGDGA